MQSTTTDPALARYFADSGALAAAGARDCDASVQDVWLGPLHLDFHRAAGARAVVVLQPGVGSYARFYAPLAQGLAREGCHVLAIDRPGHGYSGGARGDCSIAEALDATARVLAHARESFGLPVVLLGSSMGGLLTGFALLAGLRPDLAIAHNFLLPGRLVSMRLRARFISRWRRRPYPLADLANGFKGISADPALLDYLSAQADPRAAWTQSVRSVASLFAHNPPRPAAALPPLVLFSGAQDRVIPAWATRGFARWAGLRPVETLVLPGAGHMLFHDHLAQSLPLVLGAIEGHLPARGDGLKCTSAAASAAAPTTATARAG